jgi:pyrroloquinoline quinone biosynthesis protein E
MMPARSPTTLLAELTHRCPLHCPYCSNPLELARASTELGTGEWKRVFTEARALGVLQLGLSGGEPLVRRDLEELVAHARTEGLYSTLVTSGLGLTAERARALVDAGLDHVQISFQAAEREAAERIAGTRSWETKCRAAAAVRELGVAFTVNVVLHRDNLDQLEQIIELAAAFGADRLELANTQYYGWALLNRDLLLPTREQLERAEAVVERAVVHYRGRMQILYVLPDYYQLRPKPCYGGWGSVYVVVTPTGVALPCHAADSIPGITFESVRDHSLADIWERSPGFAAFRGDEWMREPCRSCPVKQETFGGCRCQAAALTGDARNADPVCSLSPYRVLVDEALSVAASREPGDDAAGYRYRAMPFTPRASSRPSAPAPPP